jgi:hypothetical protein
MLDAVAFKGDLTSGKSVMRDLEPSRRGLFRPKQHALGDARCELDCFDVVDVTMHFQFP